MESEAPAVVTGRDRGVLGQFSSTVLKQRHYAEFIVQSLVLIIVISFCLYNLSVGSSGREYWLALLGPCLGYLLPNPRPRKKEI